MAGRWRSRCTATGRRARPSKGQTAAGPEELGKLDKPVARRIVTAVEALGTDPRPTGCRHVTGAEFVL